jgi:threonine synthase
MVAAQSDGCAPVVKAFQEMKKDTEFWENSHTIALGLNVPGPLGGKWILDVLSQSNGIAISIPEEDLLASTKDMNDITGINSSAEAGVVWSAYNTLLKMDWISNQESVVLFATGIERC